MYADSNVDVSALDEFAFASRKIPEHMHWRLNACSKCDVLYSSPAPSVDALAALYREAHFDSSVEAKLASQTYGQILRSFADRLPDKIGAVDIGTGDGVFLRELLAAGFKNVVGIEPSAAPIASAAPEVRPLIRHDIFRPQSFPDNSVSLITCFQTIEHISNPLQFCTDAWRSLKPGGALFLIGHNRRSLSAKLMGRRSPIFDIEHLQLFSPDSLRALNRKAGFQTAEISTVYNRYPIQYWTRLSPLPRRMKGPVLTALQKSKIGGVIVPLPAGNLASVAFKALV